jgi:predicted DNA-binding transcriptional regulator YafY
MLAVIYAILKLKIRGEPCTTALQSWHRGYYPLGIFLHSSTGYTCGFLWCGVKMSYKFDSLIIILRKLNNKERVTIDSLKDELEVSERTAYRYLRTLQTALFPINYDRNKGSYVFDEGYSLSKPNLTLEEALALNLAKKTLGNLGTGMEKSIASIEEKLSLKKQDLPKHIVLKAKGLPPDVEKHLSIIHRAINNYQRVELIYKSLHADEVTVRKVDPYYLYFADDFWHLKGYCHLRQGFRTFALDRIQSLNVLNEHFIPENISPEEEVSGAFGVMVDQEPVEVVLRFDKEIKPYILRTKWHESQKEKEPKDGRIEVKFNVNGLDEIRQWIYKWLPYVEVISPKSLRKIVKKELRLSLEKLGKGNR